MQCHARKEVVELTDSTKEREPNKCIGGRCKENTGNNTANRPVLWDAALLCTTMAMVRSLSTRQWVERLAHTPTTYDEDPNKASPADPPRHVENCPWSNPPGFSCLSINRSALSWLECSKSISPKQMIKDMSTLFTKFKSLRHVNLPEWYLKEWPLKIESSCLNEQIKQVITLFHDFVQ